MLDCTYYNLITIFVQHIAYVFFTVGQTFFANVLREDEMEFGVRGALDLVGFVLNQVLLRLEKY